MLERIRLERIWEDRNRTPVEVVSAAIITLIALVDWWTLSNAKSLAVAPWAHALSE
jgi:hypothetical protein